ncbi:LAGLIDADG family homing endonuclease [Patescibacteria group bacterium]|nr:LAGLIDADG family homing endonuclease [Patescibacteria group bacterium]
MGVRYSFNEHFFDNWNKEMAYVLGYIFADGSLECSPRIRAHYLRITSIDLERIVAFKKLLASSHTITKTKPPVGETQYMLRIGSKRLYKSLLRYRLRPRKSLSVKMPEIPNRFLNDFVRGYFDGDGCVYIEKARGEKGGKILKGMRVIFTSGSKKFLEALEKKICERAGIKKKKVTVARRSFQLRYSTDDGVTLFKFLYRDVSGMCYMKRKLAKFNEYFKLRPKRIDSEVKYVLECVNGTVH